MSELKEPSKNPTPEKKKTPWALIAVLILALVIGGVFLFAKLRAGAWEAPKYEWSEDYSTVTATRRSTRNSDVVESATAKADSVVLQEPTCESAGRSSHTASFENKAFADQTVEVTDLPALGTTGAKSPIHGMRTTAP